MLAEVASKLITMKSQPIYFEVVLVLFFYLLFVLLVLLLGFLLMSILCSVVVNMFI